MNTFEVGSPTPQKPALSSKGLLKQAPASCAAQELYHVPTKSFKPLLLSRWALAVSVLTCSVAGRG